MKFPAPCFERLDHRQDRQTWPNALPSTFVSGICVLVQYIHHKQLNLIWLCVIYWYTATTLCLKNVPTFKLSVTLLNLNRFSKFLDCWNVYKICYKTHATLSTSCRHVATLPWEIKNSNFRQIFNRYGNHILITSKFVTRLQFFIFSAFKIASLFPYWLQIKCFMSLFFCLFTFAINLWHLKFITADITAVFVNNQHGI